MATSFFTMFVTIYSFAVLYGSVPWLDFNTWKNYPYKEYSLPQMIKKSKAASSFDQIELISPFLNGTFTKISRTKYDYPIYELNQMEKNCKHVINYDITIPPGKPLTLVILIICYS